jgi:thiol-disulfide isomerase/thioredoxin
MLLIRTGRRAAILNQKRASLSVWIACIISGATGFLLLAAAVMKAADMELFIRQITAYGLVTDPLLVTAGAWVMIAFQLTLGIALLLLYRPRISLSVAALLWLFLTGLTAYAWATGATDECGCYGSWLKSSPRQATIENLVFFGAALLGIALSRTLSPGRYSRTVWAVAAAPLVGLGLPLVFGFSVSAMIEPASRSANLGAAEVKGLEGIDLGRGSYLVVLLGTDCVHCKELLPDIDMLAEESGIPKVVALSKDNEAQRKAFVEKYEPVFPIGQVSDKAFWRLLGNSRMPKILLVQEGKVRKVWDRTVPQKDTIQTTLSQTPSLTETQSRERRQDLRDHALQVQRSKPFAERRLSTQERGERRGS